MTDGPSFNTYLSMAGSSPKTIAAILMMRIYEKYFDYMASGGEQINIQRMTAALIITCPEKSKREEIWQTFLTEKDKPNGNEMSASVYAVGEWYQYMSNALGLNESTYGGA